MAGLLLAVVVSACDALGGASLGPGPTPSPTPVPPSAPPVVLTIYGAASLKGVLDAAQAGYEAANPGTTIVISTDSSAALETKIEQGAPADVFLSADTSNPKKLVDGAFADGAAIVFAGNELAIIVPLDNPAGIQAPTYLARAGVRIIAAGDEVPIARYAAQLIANLAADPSYPVDFATGCAANVVSKEENVKAVVAKIELGEGDAAIVYKTDAIASNKVETIDIPEGANVQASYAGVVVAASTQLPAARAFLAWLSGPEGQSILDGFGFTGPPGE